MQKRKLMQDTQSRMRFGLKQIIRAVQIEEEMPRHNFEWSQKLSDAES